MPNKIDKAVFGMTVLGGMVKSGCAMVTGLGFTNAGIGAGSYAAGMQAIIGNLVAGSPIAVAQSLGASGTIAVVGTVATVPIAIGAIYGGYKLAKHLNKQRQESQSYSQSEIQAKLEPRPWQESQSKSESESESESQPETELKQEPKQHLEPKPQIESKQKEILKPRL